MLDVIRGKYRIVREIARSNDIVYEATDTSLGRRIALKELNIAPSLTGQARRERIERFNREARAAGRLSHPNIVSVFDFGEENGRHFIAMEYLEGQPLRDVLHVRGALPLTEAVNMACQVLDALAYAHNNHVIHRDIKPDNIQVLPGGQIKLTDFGIARLTEEPALTSDGQVFGTPSYMSPEQIEGRGIDHRSDIFSLGVVLYEALAGRKPFLGDSVISITYAIMNAEPPPLTGVPSGIEQVIRRALSKNPLGRQVSADQMKMDLRNAEQTPAIFLPSPSQGMNGTYGGRMPSGGISPSGGMYPPPGGYNGNPNGYGSLSPGGYVQAPNALPPPMPAPMPSGMPWTFNNGGQPGMMGQPSLPLQAPPVDPLPMNSAGGVVPYAAPPFPARPAEPLFVLSPGGRKLLLSLLLATFLGGGIGFGVIAFQRSYDQFTETTKSKQMSRLISEGVTRYQSQDYVGAAQLFEKAMAENPVGDQREILVKNLTSTYIQLARAAEVRNAWEEAQQYYQKALNISPDSTIAQDGLEDSSRHLGRTSSGVRGSTTKPSRGTADLPSSLDTHTSASGDTGVGMAPQDFLADRRAKASQLIQEGDALEKQGNLSGARDKWQEAVGIAPATPERDQAQRNLERTSDTPNFGG